MTQVEYLKERERNAHNLLYTKNTPKETADMEAAGTKRADRLSAEKPAQDDARNNITLPLGNASLSVCPIASASSNFAKSTKAAPTKVKRVEIYRGPPNDALPGGWPQGWTQIILQRQSGASSGTKDRYWFSPGGYKFSSKVQVRKFVKALAKSQGNEPKALAIFKHISI